MSERDYRGANLPDTIPPLTSLSEVVNALNFGPKAEEYAERHTNVADVHKRQIQEFLALLPANPAILEVGCGTGRDINLLQKTGAHYYGIDSVAGMLQVAKKRNPNARLSIQSLFSLGFPEKSFDGVWGAAVLHHFSIPRLYDALQSIRHVLKPEGRAFFSVREGDGIWQDPVTNVFYHRHQLDSFERHLSQNGFFVEKAERELSRPDQVYLEFMVRNDNTIYDYYLNSSPVVGS